MRGMSRLRRRVASYPWFCISCCILPWRETLSESAQYIHPKPVQGWMGEPGLAQTSVL
jgi:hypothetical protein